MWQFRKMIMSICQNFCLGKELVNFKKNKLIKIKKIKIL